MARRTVQQATQTLEVATPEELPPGAPALVGGPPGVAAIVQTEPAPAPAADADAATGPAAATVPDAAGLAALAAAGGAMTSGGPGAQFGG